LRAPVGGRTCLLPRILIIEDDAVTRRVMAKGLGRNGHTVEVVGRLADAVTVAASFQPDLIIADWLFPEGVALEVARAIRQLYPAVPMIFISGLPIHTFEQNAQPLTPLRILEKPFSLQDLRDLIRQALG